MKLIRFDDPEPNAADLEIFEVVVEVASRFNVDPFASRESETYFVDLMDGYAGTKEGLAGWLEEQIERDFLAIGERPRWIQGAAWPFAHDRPMVFAGQIDLRREPGNVVCRLFHDDASLYAFIAPALPPIVIVQVY